MLVLLVLWAVCAGLALVGLPVLYGYRRARGKTRDNYWYYATGICLVLPPVGVVGVLFAGCMALVFTVEKIGEFLTGLGDRMARRLS